MRGRRHSSCRTNLDGQANCSAESGQHVDERVCTEKVDPSTEEIADARLSHTEYLGRGSLPETARLDEFLYLYHEICANQQMLGLFAAKPQVTEYIPSGRRDLQLHNAPPSCTHRSALCNQCLISLSGKFYIVLRCFPSPFFKCMEHVDRFRKLGNVADAMFHSGMDSDLMNPLPNTRHRFPVRWLHSLLNQPKLKAREPPGIRRE